MGTSNEIIKRLIENLKEEPINRKPIRRKRKSYKNEDLKKYEKEEIERLNKWLEENI